MSAFSAPSLHKFKLNFRTLDELAFFFFFVKSPHDLCEITFEKREKNYEKKTEKNKKNIKAVTVCVER